MWINTNKLKMFLVYLYRISLISGLILGIVMLILGLRFYSQIPHNKITVKNAVAEQQKTEVNTGSGQETLRDQEKSQLLSPEEFASLKTTERLTVLLAGIDRRPDEKSISNTDSLLIAQVDPQIAQIRLLSIPRDTQVEIPGYGKSKINAAARVGKGLSTTEDLLEEVCGQPIDGYVLTNFTGFKGIIDTMGGINLTVEKDMHYNTGDSQDGVIDLKKGTQRLNGTQALQYVRFRQDALADISRTIRQQTVLKAMVKEFGQVKTLPKLPWLIPQIYQNVQTNLSLKQIWSLVNVFMDFDDINIVTQTLPGNFMIENGVSYWQINKDEARKVARDFFTEGTTVGLFSQKISSKQESLQKPSGQKSLKPGSAEQSNQPKPKSKTEKETPVPEAGNKSKESNTFELPEFEFEIIGGPK
jgi:LCP family protein required for cell wall assembly